MDLSFFKKKKQEPEEGAEGVEAVEGAEAPEEGKPKGGGFNPMALLEHVDKALLGLTLIAVAVLSILKLLEARKIDYADKAEQPIQLRGQDYTVQEDLDKELANVIAQANGKPDGLDLGKGHMVFNPKKWKDVVATNGEPPIMVPDSEENRLGVSALYVTNILPVRTIITPKGEFRNGKALYEFINTDNYPVQFPVYYGAQAPYNRIRTFFPHVPQAAREVKKRLTLNTNRGPVDLHGFSRVQILRNPDWRIQMDFKNAYLQRNPANPAKIDVFFDLNIIYMNLEGDLMTNVNQRIPSDRPIPIDRTFEADFFFYTPQIPGAKPKDFSNYRLGRHIMIDGEALKVTKLEPTRVTLWSDIALGGNGKRYVKELIDPVALARQFADQEARRNAVQPGVAPNAPPAQPQTNAPQPAPPGQ